MSTAKRKVDLASNNRQIADMGYHIANVFPVDVISSYLSEAEDWCWKNLGPSTDFIQDKCKWFAIEDTFFFALEEHCNLFKAHCTPANPVTTRSNYLCWFNDSGQLHRLDGPAKESQYNEHWYQNGVLHRVDGPAVILGKNTDHKKYFQKTFEWYNNGALHREDGPAKINHRKLPNLSMISCHEDWYLFGVELKKDSKDWLEQKSQSLPLTDQDKVEFMLRFG